MGDSGSWVRELSSLKDPWSIDAWLESLPEVARNDEPLMLQAVRRSGMALRFAGPALRCSKALVLEAVQQDPIAIRYANPDVLGDRQVFAAALGHGMSTREVVDALPKAMRLDKELMVEAVTKGYPLSGVPGQILSDEAFILHSEVLPCVAKALSARSLKPSIEREMLENINIVLALVAHDGLLLERCGSDVCTNQVNAAAVQQNYKAWVFVDEEQSYDADFVAQVMPGLKQKWREILQKDGAELEDAPEWVKEDRELVLAALSNTSSALQYLQCDNDDNEDEDRNDRGLLYDLEVIQCALDREQAERHEEASQEKRVFAAVFGAEDGGSMYADIINWFSNYDGSISVRVSVFMERKQEAQHSTKKLAQAGQALIRRCNKELDSKDLDEMFEFIRPPGGVEEVVGVVASLLRGAEQFDFTWDQRDKLLGKRGTPSRAFMEELKRFRPALASKEAIEHVRPAVAEMTLKDMQNKSQAASCLLMFAQGAISAYDNEKVMKVFDRIDKITKRMDENEWSSLEDLYLADSLLSNHLPEEIQKNEGFQALARKVPVAA